MLKLTEKDKTKLKQLHPELQKVVAEYLRIGDVPITILEAKRTLATQKKYVASGASQTLRSRHLTGHAVDIAPLDGGKASWAWPLYYKLAPQMKQAAKNVGVPIEWGGDWVKFKDGPHWQLPWKKYPSMDASASELDEGTEDGLKVKESIALGATGGGGAGTSIGDSAGSIANVSTLQQEELSTGDAVRLVIAGIVVVFTIAVLIWTWKH